MQFGADPEFFLSDINRMPVPSVGLLPGTKRKPFRLGGGLFVHEDNVMVELGCNPGNNFLRVRAALQSGVGEALSLASTAYGAELFPLSETVAEFAEAELGSRQAKVFGCEPDYGAYNMGMELAVVGEATLGNVRCAGGHIHVGYKAAFELPPFVVAAFCDLFVGLTLVRLGETQGARRANYGLSGRFRPKPYGLEYRTPSNLWLFDHYVADNINEGLLQLAMLVEHTPESEVRRVFDEVPWGDVRACIDHENTHMAVDLSCHIRDEIYGGM